MRYRGIGPESGQVVDEEIAYEYAKAHLDSMGAHDRQEFVDWFYSGNWVKEHKVKAHNQRNYEIAEGLRDEPV